MFSFSFDHILNLEDENLLSKGVYIWVLHADKIPPHVGVSINGKYFSLKVSGKDLDVHFSGVLKIIRKKNIPCLIIPLNTLLDFDRVRYYFELLNCAETGKNTCLTPWVHLIGAPENIGQLSDLLKYLKNKDEFTSVFGLNLTNDYGGIPSYGKKEIDDRLSKLEYAKRSKNIPSIR